MKTKIIKNHIFLKRRAMAYASIGNYKKYIDTGNEKFLNDVHPQKGMKKGTKYFALGEGWEERRVKL